MDTVTARWIALLCLVVAAAGAGCGGGGGGIPAFDADTLMERPTDQWVTNGGTIRNDRYSPLDEIDTGNVKDLKGDWVVHLGSGASANYSGEAQPIVHDGVIYVITGADDVFAIDADTGVKLWVYKANLGSEIKTVCCGWTSRGVAIGDGKVYVGQLDGKLVALNADSGETEWETQVKRWQEGYTITSAPLYYDGMVVTGVSGGEFGIRAQVTAYDTDSGDEKWRFHTIPGPGEKGHDTWPRDNDAWKRGGAPVWQTPAVDPELGLLYFSTGNTAPDFYGREREGDNLFANTIVALDADSGKYRWHFQQVHHDIWDYDAPSPVVLFDIELDGRQRKALAEPGKSGWVYVLDRTNGRPLIGIDERRVLQEPRQKTAPTQPYPQGDAFVPQSVPDPPRGYRAPNKGRIFTPFWKDPIVAKPGTLGGNNWPPSSFNPETNHLYVCAVDRSSVYKTSGRAEFRPEEIRRGEEFLASEFTSPRREKPRGTFTAMDMRTNEIAWQKRWSDACYSGSVTTAGGLVFTGQNDGNLLAYDARDGRQLWRFQTGAGANAPATVFERDGRQRVVFYAAGNVLAGSPHGDNLWLFSLDGDLGPSAAEANEDKVARAGSERAAALFDTNCSVCHGPQGEGGHNGPSLQRPELSRNFDAVVEQIRNGSGPMPPFKDKLSDAQIRALARYVTEEIAPHGGGAPGN
jgi:quinohemoprotein ethanol dehydrogenase